MNTRFILPLTLLNLLTGLIAHSQSARFAITGYTDRGGATSSGGTFAVAGTAGQSDTGVMSGGSYSLAGGFWGAIVTSAPVHSEFIKVSMVFNELRLRFTGIPGQAYEIERATSVTGPWRPNDQPFAVITMPSEGVVEFVDPTAVSSAQSFYRTRLP